MASAASQVPMAEGDQCLAPKRKPIEFPGHLKGQTGPTAPANPNFSVRKAWPEEKYNIKLPSAFLEDPHTHRFQRAKPNLEQNESCPSSAPPAQSGGPGPNLQQDRPQKKTRIVSLKGGNGSRVLSGGVGGYPQTQKPVIPKHQGQVLAIHQHKPKAKKPKAPVARPAVVAPTAKIDLEKKLSMSLDALSKANKGGVKKPAGKK